MSLSKSPSKLKLRAHGLPSLQVFYEGSMILLAAFSLLFEDQQSQQLRASMTSFCRHSPASICGQSLTFRQVLLSKAATFLGLLSPHPHLEVYQETKYYGILVIPGFKSKVLDDSLLPE